MRDLKSDYVSFFLDRNAGFKRNGNNSGRVFFLLCNFPEKS